MAVIFLPPEPVSLLVLVGHVLSNAEQCSLSVVPCPFVLLLLVWLKILPESRQGVFGGDPFCHDVPTPVHRRLAPLEAVQVIVVPVKRLATAKQSEHVSGRSKASGQVENRRRRRRKCVGVIHAECIPDCVIARNPAQQVWYNARSQRV